MLKTKSLLSLISALLLSTSAMASTCAPTSADEAECDVRMIDMNKPENSAISDKVRALFPKDATIYLNSVNLDNDRKREYVAIMSGNQWCTPHGCAFVALKEVGDDVVTIRTGYVPVKNGVAQCNSQGKLVFSSTPITKRPAY